jgi:hypothetical protein
MASFSAPELPEHKTEQNIEFQENNGLVSSQAFRLVNPSHLLLYPELL